MSPDDAAPREPAEHLRFAAYLDSLQQAADADEADLVGAVLTDPDQEMAQSAVLRHLDRRAAGLHRGYAYEEWATSMAQVVMGYPFLTGRLQEWSLYRAITLTQPWHRDALLASSNWLQLKVAAAANAEALQLLAENGRTKRIRITARFRLKDQSKR